jgi:SAM-dependent methyltransferase
MTETDWSRLRVQPIRWRTFVKRTLIHTDLLMSAGRRARGSLLEVGSGSGAQSALLSRTGARIVSIENDPRIMDVAKTNFDRFGATVRLIAADAFELPFRPGAFGVAISQGLMEHFDNLKIGELIREQLRVCRSVVFSVPSDHYPRQDVGNERLMPPQAWRTIVESSIDPGAYRIAVRYCRLDFERIKYSLLAKRWLGRFGVLVTIDSH